MHARHAAVAAGTLLIAAVIVAGATQISGEAGYGGVGPNFLPWLVGIALLVCGALLAWQALSGGFREMDEASGLERGHWPGFAWVSAGILLNALLITTIGFVLSCALCFMLAVRGFRSSEGRPDRGLRGWLTDLLVGAAIAAPVYWMFGKLLAINLPGLTQTGWI
ncbi:MAG: tripartite tricarboxylate transporter TctB family protein [Piscinibacter sp.]|nr:tripartite tricarboxylate transporter TctB family protein [Piscinibacter sp.]